MSLAPSYNGFDSAALNFLFCSAAITLSHPFEVARVIIQCENGKGMFGKSFKIMKSIFDSEGLTGLYRGFVPRYLHALPIYFLANEAINPTNKVSSYVKKLFQTENSS